MTRILIAGSSYVEDEGKRDLTKLWWRLVKHLHKDNPNVHTILVDSSSPFNPQDFLPDCEVLRFDDNVGAISRGQRDGAGRALIHGMRTAILCEYDYVVHWEVDFLYAHSVVPTVERMAKANVKVAAAIADPYQFCEWGISWFDVAYLRDTRFIERYGWETAPFWPIPEWRLEHLFGDDLWLLPLRGRRNEDGALNIANIHKMFPYKAPDWLTHFSDFNLAYKFIDMHGIKLT